MINKVRLIRVIAVYCIASLLFISPCRSGDENKNEILNSNSARNDGIGKTIDKAIFVLIPGWAGSTIYTCPEENSPLDKCINIYGNQSSYRALYDLSIRPGALYKHDIVKQESGSFNLYKDFSTYIEQNAVGKIDVSADNANYIELSYDWRASIKDSASYMKKKICEKTDEDSDFQFFFIGHSMGGLVLKEWLSHHKDLPCPQGHVPNVRAAAFVGTPHLGSMATLKNLLEGVLLFKIYEYQAWFEKVSPTLTQSAPWNPSSYELLPLMGSAECLNTFKSLTNNKPPQIESPVYMASSSADGKQYIDLYDSASWKGLNLFRKYHEEKYPYPSYAAVKEWLHKASKVMCELTQFNPSTKIADISSNFYPVSYVSGVGLGTTPAVIKFDSNNKMNFTIENEAGDGTVTNNSASNFPIAAPKEVKLVYKKHYKHLELLKSEVVTNILTSWLSEISFGFRLKQNENITKTTPPLTPQNYSPRLQPKKMPTLKTRPAGQPAGLIPIPPDPTIWHHVQVKQAIEENSRRLKTYGTTRDSFAQQIKSEKPSHLRVVSLVAIAALFEADSIEQLDLLVEAANTASSIQNTKVLFNLSRYVAEKLVQGRIEGNKSGLDKLKSDLYSLRQSIHLNGEISLADLIDRATNRSTYNELTVSDTGIVSESKDGHDQIVSVANNNAVTIVSGSPFQNSLYMIYDVAAALEERDSPRVVPIVSKGTVQSVNDLLYLNRVDMAVLRSDIIEYYRRLGIPADNVERRLRYVANLGVEPMRVVTNLSINSIYELKGKKVNFGYIGTDPQISSRMVLNDLGIDVQEVNIGLFEGVQSVLNGDIAATIIFEGNTKEKLVTQLGGNDKLKFISVPMNEKLAKSYQPYRIKLDEYPDLVINVDGVDTISVNTILASYAWARGNARYERVANFTKSLFNNLGKLRRQSHNSKWQDVSLTAEVPGWKRFGAAQDHLDRILGIFKSSQNDLQIKSEVKRFLLEARPRAHDDSPDGDALLYRQFLEWRQSSCGLRSGC